MNCIELQSAYNQGKSWGDVCEQFNVKHWQIYKALREGKLQSREGRDTVEIKGNRGGCFAWDSKKHSEHAKQFKFGGYRKNAGRTKKYKVVDSFGCECTLQSPYELKTAQILDKLGIKWLRPGPLIYDNRKYFADFYLTEYDTYLDPKNDYLIEKDAEKIRKVIEQNSVKLLVLSKNQITEEFLKLVRS